MKPYIALASQVTAVVLAGVALAAMAVAATAAQKEPDHCPAKTATGTPITGTLAARLAGAGIVVRIDPATGKLAAPTPEQMAKLAAARKALPGRSAQRPAPVFHANGSVSLDVRSWMREHVVVRRTAEGVVTGCVDNRAALNGDAHHAPIAKKPAPEGR